MKYHELKNNNEAALYFGSLWVFSLTHPKAPVSWFFFGTIVINLFMGYNTVKNLTTDKAEVRLAAPMSDNASFSLMPQALAGDLRADTIWIKGKAWGIKDPAFDVWKLNGKPELLIYDRPGDQVYWARSDAFEGRNIRKAK